MKRTLGFWRSGLLSNRYRAHDWGKEWHNHVLVADWTAAGYSVPPIRFFTYHSPSIVCSLYGFVKPSIHIHSEDGNCNIWRSVGKPTKFYAAHPLKPTLYTNNYVEQLHVYLKLDLEKNIDKDLYICIYFVLRKLHGMRCALFCFILLYFSFLTTNTLTYFIKEISFFQLLAACWLSCFL
jgi:hypothetical protein